MKISFFDAHDFERETFLSQNENYKFEINFIEARLSSETASLAKGTQVVCSFVNDKLDAPCLRALQENGIKFIALRSAGFNHVDISAAQELGLIVSRVPCYSPHAVAEYTIGLALCLTRKIHRASNRVKELNFSLDGLVGFDFCKKTIGVIGTGKIGAIVAKIFSAFDAKVLCHDLSPNSDLEQIDNIEYVDLNTIFSKADVISLHTPLTPETHHIINVNTLRSLKKGVVVLNTGRGALIDSKALIEGLKSGCIGGAALDVYEEEENVFFQDLSDKVLQDDTLARLLTFPNVLISSHQAFLTHEALENIASTTLESLNIFLSSEALPEERLVTSKFFKT